MHYIDFHWFTFMQSWLFHWLYFDLAFVNFFFGMFFLLALCLQFSVKISSLETQVKNLAQQLAIRDAREPEDDGSEGE